MKNAFLLALAAGALLSACNSGGPAETTTNPGGTAAGGGLGDKALNELFESYWEKNSRLDPLAATAYGDNRYNDQLPNNQTRAFRDTLRGFYQSHLTHLQAVRPR